MKRCRQRASNLIEKNVRNGHYTVTHFLFQSDKNNEKSFKITKNANIFAKKVKKLEKPIK